MSRYNPSLALFRKRRALLAKAPGTVKGFRPSSTNPGSHLFSTDRPGTMNVAIVGKEKISAHFTRDSRTGEVRIVGKGRKSPSTSWASFRDQYLSWGSNQQIETLREGIFARLLFDFAKDLDVSQELISCLVGVPLSTAKRKVAQEDKLDPLATERLLRIGAIEKLAQETFDDADLAHQWLKTPNPALGNTAPIDRLDTEIGRQQVSQVLNAITYGGVA